jgi:signal transduction histidine kinase
MIKIKKSLLLFTVFCFLAFPRLLAQSDQAKELEKQVYQYNNELQYSKAQDLIYQFFAHPKCSQDDYYWAYMYLSFTYKRLDDYDAALSYLDSALDHGKQTNNKRAYENSIRYQKTLIFFDAGAYSTARTMLQEIDGNGYQDLDEDQLSKILIMQGYLFYLDKKYSAAEAKYEEAAEQMERLTPCDLPIIYAKSIQLYAAMQKREMLYDAYSKSIKSAQFCNIIRYILYTDRMMAFSLEEMGDYKEAIYYYKQFDSIGKVYDKKEHLNTLNELDKKYQTELKNKQIQLNQDKINQKNIYIYLLLTILFTILLLVFFAMALYHYNAKKKEALIHKKFSQRLLDNTDSERERIAKELHDGIGHELLALKRQPNQDPLSEGKIDLIINDIRRISRDLHPAMLDKIGLKHAIEYWCDNYIEAGHLYVTHQIDYHKELSKKEELQLFRIIQEALSNAEKHGKCHAAKVRISVEQKLLLVQIEDNGQGFNVEEKLKGKDSFGLWSIIERCKSIGGNATIKSSSQGTSVNVEIKLKNENNSHS